MATSAEEQGELLRARRLHAAGRHGEAVQAYSRLLQGEHRESALEAMSQLYLEGRRPELAIETLAALAREHPDSIAHTARLAGVLDGVRSTDRAIRQYLQFLERRPEASAAWFNLALLYKKEKRYGDAVAAYEKAAAIGIDRPEEVWSNLGVLYRDMLQPEKAAEMYARALELEPAYVPALFNRAALFEEAGDRARAIELYERIREIDPRHWESLARIAYAVTYPAGEPLLAILEEAIAATDETDLRRSEGLHFALGKTLDDAGRHDEAFAAYRRANDAGRALRGRIYVRRNTEEAFDRLIELFDASWVRRASTDEPASHVFICGMFRSGSTLVERILAAHPAITAGGELDILPWLLARRLSPWPQAAANATSATLAPIAAEYRDKVRELFPGSGTVTDKKPDNFLHLGIVSAMFPRSRIVYTKREPLDNCLSLYFQQLGGALSYAGDPTDAAHYYRQHERLMKHWMSIFGDRIFTVDYDKLVRSPRAVVSALLDFLGLDAHPPCLDFSQAGGPVRTASVWQVRDPLYRRSSGRWCNYARQLAETRAWLEANPLR